MGGTALLSSMIEQIEIRLKEVLYVNFVTDNSVI
jgi:hypothetical protein